MEKRYVDGRGLQCPRPVIHTKKVLREMTEGVVEVQVDNEIAVQNVGKMAQQMGLVWSREDLGPQDFLVRITVGDSDPSDAVQSQASKKAEVPTGGRAVVVVGSDEMGQGDAVLGKKLLASFLYALREADTVPDKILLYNSGVRLAAAGSPALEDLAALADRGVEVMSCGICLDYYGLTDELQVGTVTNMYAIVEAQMQAEKIIKP